MSTPTSHSLDVPGAHLYYDVRGSGPVLMLVGHPMDASGFAAIAPLLAADYTVVTYDPRGFARSTIDDPGQDAEPELLADDVRRVLEAVGEGPAYVFGSSGGAVTGLALVAHYAGHVEALVAHEPPLALLLPDAEAARAGIDDIYDTYCASGDHDAWQRFGNFTGVAMGAQGEDAAAAQPPSAETMAMNHRFFRHGLLPIALYQPDLNALKDASVRVVVAGGTISKGQFAQRTAAALAERVGTPLIEFPEATPVSPATPRNSPASSAAPCRARRGGRPGTVHRAERVRRQIASRIFCLATTSPTKSKQLTTVHRSKGTTRPKGATRRNRRFQPTAPSPRSRWIAPTHGSQSKESSPATTSTSVNCSTLGSTCGHSSRRSNCQTVS
jgi:clorobiocin biosynthesis protein CloN7